MLGFNTYSNNLSLKFIKTDFEKEKKSNILYLNVEGLYSGTSL